MLKIYGKKFFMSLTCSVYKLRNISQAVLPGSIVILVSENRHVEINAEIIRVG